MCVKPNTINGYEVSCRECDACLATYKNTWVSRAVAEARAMPWAITFTLTYADVNGVPPLGARVYRYKDVQDFWKRIRRAAERRWGETMEFRYIVVGEKGTKNGRCHYHGVMFASRPITELGTLTSAKGGGLAYKRRLDWTIWGHGYVEFQPADRDGIAYALKYILKARMTAERSRNFKREGKTEWLASSYLWVSKKPPIGATWLEEKLHELAEKGMCPPALRVRVPGGGDWYVNGAAQELMCLWLKRKNDEYRLQRGRDLAGWKTLIQSVSDPIQNSETGEIMPRKAMEWLINGEEKEQDPENIKAGAEAEYDAFKARYIADQQRRKDVAADRQRVRQCGNVRPCADCWARIGHVQRASVWQEEKLLREEFETKEFGEPKEFDRWWRTRLRPSRGCLVRDSPELQNAFERLVALTRAGRGTKGKAAIGKGLQKAPR